MAFPSGSPFPWGPLPPRRMEPEILDQTDVLPADRLAAYNGLDRLQRLARTARRQWNAARPALRPAIAAGRPIRWVDLACGSGRILLDVVRIARRQGVRIAPVGVDFSDESLAIAKRNADAAGIDVQWVTSDLVAAPLPPEVVDADAIGCSLFLHHLPDDQVRELLAKIAATDATLVVDDLRRSRLSFALAYLTGRLFTRSRIVHEDGAISVRAALEPSELRAIADDAGLDDATLLTQWPERMVLVRTAPGIGCEREAPHAAMSEG